MPKRDTPLITERLILRRKQDKDVPQMLELFNNEEVRRYLGGDPPRSRRVMERMLKQDRTTQWDFGGRVADTAVYTLRL